MSWKLSSTDLVHFFELLDACEPALAWMRERIAEKPDITPVELWNAALKVNERVQGAPETNVGWSWLAWVARFGTGKKVACGTGLYSGRMKVHDGPNVDKLAPEHVFAMVMRHHEWLWLLKMAKLEDELGEFPPGGATGGACNALLRLADDGGLA